MKLKPFFPIPNSGLCLKSAQPDSIRSGGLSLDTARKSACATFASINQCKLSVKDVKLRRLQVTIHPMRNVLLVSTAGYVVHNERKTLTMRILRTTFAVLLGVCGAASAQDPMELVKFHSSTAIMVAGTEFPAGDDTIQVRGISDGNVVLLVRSEFGPQAFVLTNRLNGAAPHGNGEVQVTLQRRGGFFSLAPICLPGHNRYQMRPPSPGR